MERVSINELTTVPKWIMVCRSGYVRQHDSLQSLNRDIYAGVIIMMIIIIIIIIIIVIIIIIIIMMMMIMIMIMTDRLNTTSNKILTACKKTDQCIKHCYQFLLLLNTAPINLPVPRPPPLLKDTQQTGPY